MPDKGTSSVAEESADGSAGESAAQPAEGPTGVWVPQRLAAPLPPEAIEIAVELLAARDAVSGLEAEVGALRAHLVRTEDEREVLRRDNADLAKRVQHEWERAEELEITSRHFHRLALSVPGRVARVLFRPVRRFVVEPTAD
jgi:hypothetical protein